MWLSLLIVCNSFYSYICPCVFREWIRFTYIKSQKSALIKSEFCPQFFYQISCVQAWFRESFSLTKSLASTLTSALNSAAQEYLALTRRTPSLCWSFYPGVWGEWCLQWCCLPSSLISLPSSTLLQLFSLSISGDISDHLHLRRNSYCVPGKVYVPVKANFSNLFCYWSTVSIQLVALFAYYDNVFW